MEVENYQKVKGKTSYEYGTKMYKDLEKKFNVNLEEILLSKELSYDQIKERAVEALSVGVRKYHEKHENKDWLSDGKFSKNPGAFKVVSPVFMKASQAVGYGSLEGDEVEAQLQRVSSNMSRMLESSDYGVASFYMISAGFLAITGAGAVGFITAVVTGASEAIAIAASLSAMGSTAIVAVVIIVITLIMFFVYLREAKLLALVINNTSRDLVVKNYREKGGNLYINTGKMSDFMNQEKNIGEVGHDAPQVQIHRKMDWIFDGEVEMGVFGGWYFAEKRDGELLGADGAMIITDDDDDNFRIAQQYAVPWSKHNGTNIKMLTNDENDAKKIFKELRNSQKERVVITEGKMNLTSSVNSIHGQDVSLIASITEE